MPRAAAASNHNISIKNVRVLFYRQDLPNASGFLVNWSLILSNFNCAGYLDGMDHLTSKQRSANMRQIKSKGMKPELKVRRMVHSMGYRFRLHKEDLPGKPDLVFTKLKKVIFVHGCFWHQHAARDCPHCHTPRTNQRYWKAKLLRNVKRDKASRAALKKAGWQVLVLWECELKKDASLNLRLKRFLSA